MGEVRDIFMFTSGLVTPINFLRMRANYFEFTETLKTTRYYKNTLFEHTFLYDKYVYTFYKQFIKKFIEII